jgi:hypothetical protein
MCSVRSYYDSSKQRTNQKREASINGQWPLGSESPTGALPRWMSVLYFAFMGLRVRKL